MEINGLICGTGGKGLPLPEDPDNNLTLYASTGHGGIDLRWTLPIRNAHAVAHVYVIRADTSDFSAATQIAVVGGNYYFDAIKTDTNKDYYYWIQVVSINGTKAEPIGWVKGTAVPMSKYIIDTLSGKINEGILAKELRTKIDRIIGLEDGITEAKEFSKNESSALASVVGAVQATLNDATALVYKESLARAEDNKAFANKVEQVQATLNHDIATTRVEARTEIDKTNNKMNALWTAKVDVNGNVGGFGLVGTGDTVEAGFDVDRFWVGRNTSKTKPFLIENDIVYMNEVVIKKGTIKSAHIGNLEVATDNISNNAVSDYEYHTFVGNRSISFNLKKDGYILLSYIFNISRYIGQHSYNVQPFPDYYLKIVGNNVDKKITPTINSTSVYHSNGTNMNGYTSYSDSVNPITSYPVALNAGTYTIYLNGYIDNIQYQKSREVFIVKYYK